MPEPRTLVWFRADLRVADNPALHTAAKRGPVVGLFLLAYEQWREHDWGHNRLRFLLDHLSALSHRLAELGIPLRVRTCDRFADAAQAVLRAARDEGCDAVYCNREYEWNERQRDRGVAELLRHNGIEIAGFDDQVLLRPGTVQTGAGGFFTVFTPFRKACLKLLADGLPQPLPEPAAQGPSIEPTALPESPPDFPGADADLSRFPVGEDAAHARLEAFVAEQQVDYAARRDFPGIDGTSGLSPYLACGAISARQCFDVGAAREPFDDSTFLTEILWREFYRHVVFGFPHVCRGHAFRRETDRLPWRNDAEQFAAWQEGRTGIPIVDAGMRQLLATGWMHNRLRMVAAMFLSKNLFLDWRLGERHFMQHLVDGDFASNNGGWQWSASTGTDAAPYFRIFNPMRQAERFDPDGTFVRTWVGDPSAPDYPRPIVDLDASRRAAIEQFKADASS